MTWITDIVVGALIGCAVGCTILGIRRIVMAVRLSREPRRSDDDPWDEYVDGAMGDYPRVPDDHDRR